MMSEDEFAGLIEAAFVTIVFKKKIGINDHKDLINTLEAIFVSYYNDYPDCIEYFKKELKKLKRSKNVEAYKLPSYRKRES